MNISALLQDHGIEFSENKNWIQLQCPHPGCGDSGQHLGWNVDKEFFHCWKGGFHKTLETLSLLLKKPMMEALNVLKGYQGIQIERLEAGEVIRKFTCLPNGCMPLGQKAREYLKSRNFDPDAVQEKYGLRDTGHLGKYKFRIAIPIFWEGRIVSFDARDYTGKAAKRYLGCPGEEEAISRKKILYGLDYIQQREIVIVVEGIPSVWRLGDGAVATFGTSFTQEQVLLLSRFKSVVVMFDEDAAGSLAGKKLASALDGLTQVAHLSSYGEKDPADLMQAKADELKKLAMGGVK